MSSNTYAEIRRLFEAALKRGPEERRAFLERLELREPRLAAELRSLLEPVEGSRGVSVPGIGPAGRVLGDFRIEQEIASGRMGIVYRAHQLSADRTVALKVLGGALVDREEIERFRREAAAAAKLDHDSICRIIYVGQDTDVLYLAMEYVEGRSLRDLIDRRVNGVSPGEASDDPPAGFDKPLLPDSSEESREYVLFCCDVASRLASGLEYAHEQGVIHRDIKPGNIMLAADGGVKIIDFGIARFFDDRTLTRAGQLVGTPRYMSPEQVAGRLRVDHRTDTYSLGVVLYELLALEAPWRGRTLQEILYGIMTKQAVPLRWKNEGVSESLQAVVHKAISRDPARRYQRAKDFATDLRDCASGKRVAAPRYRYRFDRTEVSAKRPQQIVLIAFVCWALGALLGVFAYLFHESPMVLPVFSAYVALCIAAGLFLLSGYGWARGLAFAAPLGLAFIGQFHPLSFFFYPVVLGLAAAGCFLFRGLSAEWFRFARKARSEYRQRRGRSRKPLVDEDAIERATARFSRELPVEESRVTAGTILVGLLLAGTTLMAMFSMRVDEDPPDVSDLEVVWPHVDDDENGYLAASFLFEQFPESLSPLRDRAIRLGDFPDLRSAPWDPEYDVWNERWDPQSAGEFLNECRVLVEGFDRGVALPHFQARGPAEGSRAWYFRPWESLASIVTVRLRLSVEEGRIEEAYRDALKLVRFGHRLQYALGGRGLYWAGTGVKETGLNNMASLTELSVLDPCDLKSFIEELTPFRDSRDGLVDSMKVEFQRSPNGYTDGNYLYGRRPNLATRLVAEEVRIRIANVHRRVADREEVVRSIEHWSSFPGAELARYDEFRVSATQLLLALKCYEGTHGELPTSLSALVPDFFEEIPRDPFDEQPMRYSKSKKIIYSVGAFPVGSELPWGDPRPDIPLGPRLKIP